MAKKQKAEVAAEEPVMVAPLKKDVKPQFEDKLYELTIGETPITYVLKTRGLLWFDKNLGYEREIKYCQNQKTIFKDEMKGPERLSHVIFRDGMLFVPKEQQTLQTFLAHHHHKQFPFLFHLKHMMA